MAADAVQYGEGLMWEWVALAAGGLAGWYVRNIGGKADRKHATWRLEEANRLLLDAETRGLQMHRREIANILIGIDPELMSRSYDRGWQYQRELLASPPERIEADMASLAHKFPNYLDFDIFGTRHFVPYSETLRSTSQIDIIDRYLDVSKWLLLLSLRNGKKPHRMLFDEEDFKVLERCMRSVRDGRLKRRIEAAMDAYYLFDRTLSSYGTEAAKNDRQSFEQGDRSVHRLYTQYSPEIEYGVSLREPEEYGVYSSYVHDNGKITHTYSRSEATFEKRHYLDWR
ncbi:hypothetical protein [Rhizobium leguminosarum]|uniref:hypothetical protein n=1 Tax=Rhizobium leguminosarum TaxID=384 RepID=UPI001C964BFC|nr:hypothetical protein [Rhizobium leguminosarum]MBY5660918.1 hypothetical protein [Rhizobium leguminosarum]MBY5674954.1 hypothetical protein [Rhizobium leguminosarum]